MSIFNQLKVTGANHLPSNKNKGVFRVFSHQFNNLIDALEQGLIGAGGAFDFNIQTTSSVGDEGENPVQIINGIVYFNGEIVQAPSDLYPGGVTTMILMTSGCSDLADIKITDVDNLFEQGAGYVINHSMSDFMESHGIGAPTDINYGTYTLTLEATACGSTITRSVQLLVSEGPSSCVPEIDFEMYLEPSMFDPSMNIVGVDMQDGNNYSGELQIRGWGGSTPVTIVKGSGTGKIEFEVPSAYQSPDNMYEYVLSLQNGDDGCQYCGSATDPMSIKLVPSDAPLQQTVQFAASACPPLASSYGGYGYYGGAALGGKFL